MRIVAAMSGGVDSSVVAALLVEQGHEVIGVHMKLHDVPASVAPSQGKHCCGFDDAMDARRVAHDLGIPFYVMDLREAFKKAVMDNLADTYLRGATPNPCIQCNGVLKFRILLERAKALGASHLATGHYARITEDGRLARAVDGDKDQSYFLFPIRPEVLDRVRFPLGGMTKAEVRTHARRLGLVNADKPESQEICFIPDDDHTGFIGRLRPDAEGAGEIVNQQGQVLGHHDAYWRYTVGQRRGLGIAIGAPLYVLDVQAATKRVVVGPASALEQHRLQANGMTWFRKPAHSESVQARIRHRGALHPCTVEMNGEDVTVCFKGTARAPARGQAVVLYDGDVVLGGGWISRVGL